MTLGIDRFREQLMGYLYGELEGESLREFEDSLRASEQYRTELSALQQTLRVSRQGLDALRERDMAPPSSVSRAVLAAAAEAAMQTATAPEVRGEESDAVSARRREVRDGERDAPSFWSFLRTPWLLPTLGVAAAVSVVVLHKPVESPKMPNDLASPAQQVEQAPEAAPERRELGAAPPRAEPRAAPSGAASSAGKRGNGVGVSPSDRSAVREQKQGVASRADEAPATPQKAATTEGESTLRSRDQGRASTKGYAVPPPAWSGRAHEESAKKELGEARRVGSSGAGERAEEHEAPAARDMGSDGFVVQSEGRGGGGVGGVGAEKPAVRARRAPTQAAPVPAASAPAASAPLDDTALARESTSAAARAEPSRAPDDAVKKALEHMTARRFGQAAVAYRELLQRYPKDSRAPFFRSQLTAALAALSNVDAIR